MALQQPITGGVAALTKVLWGLVRGATNTAEALESTGGALHTIVDSGAVTATPAAPTAANILAGAVTAAGTVITVPAGGTWAGSVSISATEDIAAGGAATSASATLSVNGAGAAPSGAIMVVQLRAPASTVGGSGTNDSGHLAMAGVHIRAPVGNAVTLDLTASGTTTVAASAAGVLIA